MKLTRSTGISKKHSLPPKECYQAYTGSQQNYCYNMEFVFNLICVQFNMKLEESKIGSNSKGSLDILQKIKAFMSIAFRFFFSLEHAVRVPTTATGTRLEFSIIDYKKDRKCSKSPEHVAYNTMNSIRASNSSKSLTQ